MAARILFVDDEPGIRLSLPAVLSIHGFEVTTAGTVAEALDSMNKAPYDVLISDLNIGHPGDGFTVVSAMRRTQPECVTLILTGYPAFETALQAIRSQVDDYLIKPAPVDALVTAIEKKLHERQPHRRIDLKRLPTLLRDNADDIAEVTAKQMDQQLARSSRSADHREHLVALIRTIASDLEAPPDDAVLTNFAQRFGRLHQQLGFTLPSTIGEIGLLCSNIHECIQANLISVDVSYLVTDLQKISEVLISLIRETARPEFQSTPAA
ncbi:MAG TPA: response regulator [Terriglobales bacterium]|nr:response regulator [Terriglobales bacterium]